MTVEKIGTDGTMHMANSIKLTIPAHQGASPGQQFATGIRSEEVIVIRPNKPIGPDLQDNLFQGTVTDILAFGGTHTLCVKLRGSDVSIDVELPNCAMRDLGYAIGDDLQICLRKRSLWSLPLN